MTLREEVKDLSNDYIIEGINPSIMTAGMIAVQTLSAAALFGLAALIANLGDKMQSASIRNKAEKALKALNISEDEKDEIRAIAESNAFSNKLKKEKIKRKIEEIKGRYLAKGESK